MRQSRLMKTALSAIVMVVVGLATAQQGEADFEALRQEWANLYNQGDAMGVGDLYREDAALYDADGSVYEGREAIQEALRAQIEAGFAEISIEAIETETTGDLAYELGRYTTRSSGGEAMAEGHYLVISRRDNGEWRIHRHVANMVLPEEMMAQMMGGQAAGEQMMGEGPHATVQVAEHDTHGAYLTDAEGRTLYLFLNDAQGESVCYDNCAANWPPLLSTTDPEAGEGIDAGLLGTTERQDGSTQVTYNDWPLYTFIRDEAPGDVTGQGVGGNWFLVSPEGEAIEGQ